MNVKSIKRLIKSKKVYFTPSILKKKNNRLKHFQRRQMFIQIPVPTAQPKLFPNGNAL